MRKRGAGVNRSVHMKSLTIEDTRQPNTLAGAPSRRECRRRRLGIGAAALIAVSLGAVACSSSGSSQAGDASKGTGTLSLTVGTSTGNPDQMFKYVAEQEGMYAAHGLQVKLVSIPSSPNQTAALESGSIGVADSTITTFLSAPKALDLRLIPVGGAVHYPLIYALNSIKTANAGSSFPSPMKDLVGKTIGVPILGPGPQTIVEKMLTAAGISPSQVHFIAYGSPANGYADLKSGRIQASYGTVGTLVTEKVTVPDGYVVAYASQVSTKLDQVFFPDVDVSTASFLNSNASALKDYCTANTEAIAWMKNSANKAQLTKLAQTYFGISNPTQAYAAIHTSSQYYTTVTKNDFTTAQNFFGIGSGESYNSDVYGAC
jgi:NitT/TauT family transport system substrate-binding protein